MKGRGRQGEELSRPARLHRGRCVGDAAGARSCGALKVRTAGPSKQGAIFRPEDGSIGEVLGAELHARPWDGLASPAGGEAPGEAMTKQGEAGASDSPPSPRSAAGTRAASPSPSGPRGGAVAGGRPGRCVVVAGGGGRPRAEGGGKIAALPLAAGSLAAPGGDGGSGGSARPGASHSPAPSAPRGADHGCQVGGEGRRGHVTEPGHVTAAPPGGPGWFPAAGAVGSPDAPRSRPGGGGLCALGESGSARRRSWGTPALREPGGRGVRRGRRLRPEQRGSAGGKQKEPVCPEGRGRPRGGREPCLDGAGPPRGERGSLSRRAAAGGAGRCLRALLPCGPLRETQWARS